MRSRPALIVFAIPAIVFAATLGTHSGVFAQVPQMHQSAGLRANTRNPQARVLAEISAFPRKSREIYRQGAYEGEVTPTTTTISPPPPPVAAPPESRPASELSSPSPPVGGVWACVRGAESSGNYADDTGNGYYGAYQFLPSTWDAVARRLGMTIFVGVLPSIAPPAVQDRFAVELEAEDGWSQWGARTRDLCGLG